MFSSIVIPLDLQERGDRALPLAAALAAGAGIPLDLVTVSSPGMTEEFDRYELEQRGREANTAFTTTILHDNDPAAAIVGFVAQRPSALVVMATRARSAVGELVLGSVSEGLLSHGGRPFLLVGPRAATGGTASGLTPVAGVDGGPRSRAVVEALAAWSAAFHGPAPWLVAVLPATEEGDVRRKEAEVRRLAAELQGRGLAAQSEISHARDPVDALIDVADRVDDAVIVVASAHWTDPEHPHLRSVARRLARDAHHPVLVVPAEHVVTASAP